MHPLRKIWRSIKAVDRRDQRQYLKKAEEPRLHIGGGYRILEGWLNTDLVPTPNVSYLDATTTFPFPAGSFDYVYFEHMIEHISYTEGIHTVSECFKVLRPGGVIRVVTPDLDSVLAIHHSNPSSRSAEYLNWMASTFVPDAPKPSSTFVINAMFRLWGHQFLYDSVTLQELLATAGFVNIKRCRIDESERPILRNISNAIRYPSGLLDYESLCLEATRP
jgi:predicted SAM-dependent methyltransferase